MIRRLAPLYSFLVTMMATVFFGIVALICAPIELFLWHRRYTIGRLGPSTRLVRYSWSKFMLWAHQVRVEVSGPGAQTLKSMRGCIFALNHQSAVDILVTVEILPKDALFVAKRELLFIPIFGQAAWLSGIVYVDRSKGTQNKSLGALPKLLKAGASIMMYPEGTRSGDGKLLPFKRGAFTLAIENQAPIVPITILDSRKLCPKHQLFFSSGTVHVHVDTPISTTGMTHDDRFALTQKVEEIIRDRLARGLDAA